MASSAGESQKIASESETEAMNLGQDASPVGERDALQHGPFEQERNLRLAQKLLCIAIWKLEFATGRLIWCEHSHHVFGVSRDELAADFDAYLALVHPDDRTEIVKYFEAFKNSDAATFEFAHRIQCPDGTTRNVRSIAEREEIDGTSWLTGVVQDVTAEVQAREKLAEADSMQRIAKRIARVGSWRIDLNPTRTSWSPETFAIHEEPEGTSPSLDASINYYVPEYRECLRSAFNACVETGQRVDEIAQLVTAKGNRIWVRAIGEPVRGDKGTVIAVRGAFQDISDLVAARDQSEDLARRLRDTLESISDAFYLLDQDWRFSFINGQAEALLGKSCNDLIGKVCWDVFPSAVGTMIQHQYETAVNTGQSVRFQEYFSPLGTWLDVAAHPTPEGLAVYFRDVTEDRARDEHLRLLEAAVSRQNDILLITEAQPIHASDWPKIVYVNDAFTKLTGFSRDEAIGNTPDILDGPNTERAGLDRIHEALEKRRPVRTELVNYTKSGQEFWLEVDITPLTDDETGLVTHWISVERDITERKLTEAARQRSEERFRLVVKATRDVISDWDMTSRIMWWNENFQSHFGYNPALVEAGPEAWINRIHPEDKDWVLDSLNQAIAGSASIWSEEYRFLHADGRVMTCVDRAFVLRNAEGKAVRMLGSMIDVTSEREMERQLGQAQKLEAVGQLTGGIAHDFNNLLAVILGNADMLSADLGDQDQLRKFAENIATAAERGASLTHRLLAFSRKQPLRPRPTDVGALVQEMAPLLHSTLSEDIKIEIMRAHDLWQTEVDPSQLDSSLLNLALNARDAMPEGGRLTIETANAKLEEGDAACDQGAAAGEYVTITVRDTGEGIRSDLLSHVFEPFFTTKEVGSGSGLGLSVVHGFVKQSGGHVRIQSEPGEGTSVKLYFKRLIGADAIAPAQPSSRPLVGGSETILVTEDDAMVREHLVGQLNKLGYEVIGAASGPDAVETLKEAPEIDLLFTDVVMLGGMNGRELAQIAQALRPEIKVLFSSGYSEDALVQNGRLAPDVDLLSKPYRREELATKLRTVLDRN